MGRTAALSLNSGRGDWTLSQARLRGSGRPKQLEEGTGWGGGGDPAGLGAVLGRKVGLE